MKAGGNKISVLAGLALLLAIINPLSFAGEIVETRLDNGLTLLALEDHSSPLAVVRVFYHVGIKDECPGMTGITRICSRILSEGTPQFKKGEHSRIIQAGGGWSMHLTGLDVTDFWTMIPSNMLDTVLFLEADRMENVEMTIEKLLLAKDFMRKARLLYVESSIYGHINEEFYNLSYRLHPYGNPRYGWPADIDNINLDDLKEYYRLYFQPANATIVILGDFDTEKTVAKVKELFGKIAAPPLLERRRIVEPEPAGERHSYLKGFAGIPAFIIGYRVPEIGHGDIPALEVISKILTGGESSRIHKRMVIDEKSALIVGGGLQKSEDPGMLYCFSILNYDSYVSDGLSQMDEEIELLRSEYVSDAELEMVKNRIEADFYREISTLDATAKSIGLNYIIGGEWQSPDKIVQQARTVTKEDVMRAAQEYLDRSFRVVIVLEPTGPERRASEESSMQ
ncbi:MAG: insulinase family protein [Candidatus Zixiibacteriota bacterium]|nr:MAG: insulinase family protein [candidate division Zixibacteria bacterium]